MFATSGDLNKVFDNYPQGLGVGVLVYDTHQKSILEANKQAELLLGFRTQTLVGCDLEVLNFSVDRNPRETSAYSTSHLLFNNKEQSQFRGFCKRTDGSHVEVQLELSEIGDEQLQQYIIFIHEIEEPLNLWHSNTPISEQPPKPLAVQQSTDETEEWNSELLNQLPIPILVCDRDDNILAVNNALGSLLELPTEQFTKGADLLSVPAHQETSLINILLSKKDQPITHLVLANRFGKTSIVEAKWSATQAKNGSECYTICLLALNKYNLPQLNQQMTHPLQSVRPDEQFFMVKLNENLEITFANRACWDCIKDAVKAVSPAKLPFTEMLFRDADKATVTETFEALRSEKFRETTLPLKMQMATGRIKDVLWNVSSLWDDKGSTLKYVLVGLPSNTEQGRKNELDLLVSYQREAEKDIESTRIKSLIEGQEREREHISRELHDSLGQILVASRRLLSQYIRKNESSSDSSLNDLKGSIDEAVAEVRRISHGLAAGILEEYGLVIALENMLSQYANDDISVTFDTNVEHELRLSKTASRAFYRIAQEACTNALKHSYGTELNVNLSTGQNGLTMTVRDNGIGMDKKRLEQVCQGEGMRNLHSRALQIGAEFYIDSTMQRGTTIQVIYNQQ